MLVASRHRQTGSFNLPATPARPGGKLWTRYNSVRIQHRARSTYMRPLFSLLDAAGEIIVWLFCCSLRAPSYGVLADINFSSLSPRPADGGGVCQDDIRAARIVGIKWGTTKSPLRMLYMLLGDDDTQYNRITLIKSHACNPCSCTSNPFFPPSLPFYNHREMAYPR